MRLGESNLGGTQKRGGRGITRLLGNGTQRCTPVIWNENLIDPYPVGPLQRTGVPGRNDRIQGQQVRCLIPLDRRVYN